MALIHMAIIFNSYKYKKLYFLIYLNDYFINNPRIRNCKRMFSLTCQLCIGRSTVRSRCGCMNFELLYNVPVIRGELLRNKQVNYS